MIRKYYQHEIQKDVNEIEMDKVYNFQQINFNIYNLKFDASNTRRGNQNYVPQTKQKQEKPKQQRPDFTEQYGVSNNPVVQQYNNKSIKGSLSNRVQYQQGKIAILNSNMNLQNNKQIQQNLNQNPASQRVVSKQIHQNYQNPLIESKNLEIGLYQSPKQKDNLQTNQQYNNQHKNQQFVYQYQPQLFDNQHKNNQSDTQQKNQQFDNQYKNQQSDIQYKNQLFDNQNKNHQPDNMYKIRSLDNLRIHQLQNIPQEDFISSPIKDFQNQMNKLIRRQDQIIDQIKNDSNNGRNKILQNHQKYQIYKSERSHKVEHTLGIVDTNSYKTKKSQERRNRTDVQLGIVRRNQDEIFETILSTKYSRCVHCMQQQDHESFQLSCQHSYHVQCLIEKISHSIQAGNTIIFCTCKTKIPQKQVLKLLENHKQFQDTLFKNQLKELIKSFVINTKNANIVYDQYPKIIVKQGITAMK